MPWSVGSPWADFSRDSRCSATSTKAAPSLPIGFPSVVFLASFSRGSTNWPSLTARAIRGPRDLLQVLRSFDAGRVCHHGWRARPAGLSDPAPHAPQEYRHDVGLYPSWRAVVQVRPGGLARVTYAAQCPPEPADCVPLLCWLRRRSNAHKPARPVAKRGRAAGRGVWLNRSKVNCVPTTLWNAYPTGASGQHQRGDYAGSECEI